MTKFKHNWTDLASRYFGQFLYLLTPILFISLLAMIVYSTLNLAFIKSNGSWPIAATVSIAITVLVWLFIKHVTYLIYKEGGLLSIGILGFVLWGILFMASGYSLVSFLVITTYSPKVIEQTTREVITAYTTLKGSAYDMLYGGEYAAFIEKIEGTRRSLHNEIFNNVPEKQRKNGRTTTCGIGEGAKKILSSLENDLPGYKTRRFLEEREHDCSKIESLQQIENDLFSDINAQEAKIKETKFRLKERDQIYNTTYTVANKQIDTLNELLKEIQSPNSQFNLPLLLKSTQILHHSEQEYNALATKIREPSIKLPQDFNDTIDTSAIQQVMDHIGIMRYLYKHFGFNRLTLQAVIAALFDFLVMMLLSFYAKRWVARRIRFKIQKGRDDINGTGVRFLLRPKG